MPERSRIAEPVLVLGTVAFTVAAVWTAGVLLPGFRLDGTVVQQLVSAGIVAVLYIAVPRSAAFFVHRGSGSAVAARAAAAVTAPAALWLAVWVSQALGRPVHLDGLRPTLLAVVLLVSVRKTVGVAFGFLSVLPIRRDAFLSVRAALEVGASWAGLWLAVAALDGVRLSPASTGLHQLGVFMLASLFTWIPLPPNLRWTGSWGSVAVWLPVVITAVLHLGSNAVKLAFVSWISTWTVVTLSVSGVGTFCLATLLLTVLMWSARLVPGGDGASVLPAEEEGVGRG